MDNDTKKLMLKVAGFLTVLTKGMIPVTQTMKEATQRLDEIGEWVKKHGMPE